MTLWNFLKDRIMLLLLHLICMLGSFFYLYLCGMQKNQMILFYAFWSVILILYLCMCWHNRKQYFQEIFKMLEKLDKPYLISEIMPSTWHLEDRLYQKLLKQTNKSIIDEVHHLETERTEYKEFIENWIHEAKLPLTAMNLMCDNRKGKNFWEPADTHKLKSLLNELENDVDKALYYARSDTVYQDYMLKEIALKDVVISVLRRSQSYLIQNHVGIDTQIEDERVYCDGKWLEFILNQIIMNAVKYKNENGCRITIRAEKENRKTILSLEDNGIGIKPEELGRIFEKGFTGSNGRHNRESTGIGLYLCKKLSRKLGITLEAESEEGLYTRILILFPDGSSHFGREA